MANDDPVDIIGFLASIKFYLLPGALVAIAVFAALQLGLGSSATGFEGAARASALIYVADADEPVSAEAVESYVVIANSKAVTEAIAQGSAHNRTAPELRTQLSVTRLNSSLLIAVTADGANVKQATKRAESARRAVIKHVSKEIPVDSSLAQPALRPLGSAYVESSIGTRQEIKALITRAGTGFIAGIAFIALARLVVRRVAAGRR